MSRNDDWTRRWLPPDPPGPSRWNKIVDFAGVILFALALAGIITLWALTLVRHAHAGLLAKPDPILTPGAIASTSIAEVCAHGYSPRHRVWHDKAGTLARYGIPLAAAARYEDDDRIPICLGGDNASPLNHWPEPWAQARVKDGIEARMCRAVCAGAILLNSAQRFFLSLEWLDDINDPEESGAEPGWERRR